jgi:D-alanine-D-alanine ligase
MSGRVAVMMGGKSAERAVSLNSGAAVLAALLRVGVDARAFDPSVQELSALREQNIERVFIALHGRGGEDGTMQGALELMGIPYTGSGVLASALAMDKWRSKLVWQAAGIPVPEFLVITADSDFSAVEQKLGLPLFVKPANEGSSIGISKVKQPGGLSAAYAVAAKFDSVVLAERFLAGGEYTVGIVGDQVLPVIRIVPTTEFYDYESKYVRDDTEYRIPSGLSGAGERELQQLARRAFDIIGGRGWGRVDMMLDAAGKPYVLEINTSPGMTDHSLVPMAARAAGMSFDQFVAEVLQGAQRG